MSIVTLRPRRRKPTPFAFGLDGPRVLATFPINGNPHWVAALTEHDLPAAQSDPAERRNWHVRTYAAGREVSCRGFDVLREAQVYLGHVVAPPVYDDPALDDDLAWPGEADAVLVAASRGFELPEGGAA